MSLRKATIRLAYEKPHLRAHLLPLIKEAAEQEARYEEGEDVPLSELPEELQENVRNPPESVKKLREQMQDKAAARYSRDPYWMNARRPGVDDKGRPFQRGDRVLYYPATKTIMTGPEAEAAWREFDSAAFDEDFGFRGAHGKVASDVVSIADGIERAAHYLVSEVWNRLSHHPDYREAFRLMSKPGNLGAYAAGFEAHIVNQMNPADPGYMLVRIDGDPRSQKPVLHVVLNFPRTKQASRTLAFDWDDNGSALLGRVWRPMQDMIDSFFLHATDVYNR